MAKASVDHNMVLMVMSVWNMQPTRWSIKVKPICCHVGNRYQEMVLRQWDVACSARALRALMGFNGSEQPHFGFPPHTPIPSAHELHLSSAWALHSLPELYCKFTCFLLHLLLGPWPSAAGALSFGCTPWLLIVALSLALYPFFLTGVSACTLDLCHCSLCYWRTAFSPWVCPLCSYPVGLCPVSAITINFHFLFSSPCCSLTLLGKFASQYFN